MSALPKDGKAPISLVQIIRVLSNLGDGGHWGTPGSALRHLGRFIVSLGEGCGVLESSYSCLRSALTSALVAYQQGGNILFFSRLGGRPCLFLGFKQFASCGFARVFHLTRGTLGIVRREAGVSVRGDEVEIFSVSRFVLC